MIRGRHSLHDVFARPSLSTASSAGGLAFALNQAERHTAAMDSDERSPMEGINTVTRGSSAGICSLEDVIMVATPSSRTALAGRKGCFDCFNDIAESS